MTTAAPHPSPNPDSRNGDGPQSEHAGDLEQLLRSSNLSDRDLLFRIAVHVSRLDARGEADRELLADFQRELGGYAHEQARLAGAVLGFTVRFNEGMGRIEAALPALEASVKSVRERQVSHEDMAAEADLAFAAELARAKAAAEEAKAADVALKAMVDKVTREVDAHRAAADAEKEAARLAAAEARAAKRAKQTSPLAGVGTTASVTVLLEQAIKALGQAPGVWPLLVGLLVGAAVAFLWARRRASPAPAAALPPGPPGPSEAPPSDVRR